MSTEHANQREVDLLNQRGGRALSIVDLIEDGTLSAEMASLCLQAVRGGAAFLTGAVPGGAGKTTLMAAVLAFLPQGERIVTVADRSAIDAALAGRLPAPTTLLAHEIGAGRWFGYIWGRDAADFFRLPRSTGRVVPASTRTLPSRRGTSWARSASRARTSTPCASSSSCR